MSYKHNLENITEIRKVKWDELWHIVYMFGKGETYDRVTKEEALALESEWDFVWKKPLTNVQFYVTVIETMEEMT